MYDNNRTLDLSENAGRVGTSIVKIIIIKKNAMQDAWVPASLRNVGLGIIKKNVLCEYQNYDTVLDICYNVDR